MSVQVDSNGDVVFEDSEEGDFTFHACDWDTIVAYVAAARTTQ